MNNQLYQAADIHSFLKQIKQDINNQLSEIIKKYQSPCSTLQEAIEYVVLSNGKRLRPALIYGSYNLIDPIQPIQQNQIIQKSACAIELIHTYSLVHDDLPSMDNDNLRRGQPACHVKFNEATAILVGDGLQTLAFDLLSEHDPNSLFEQQLAVINIISKASGIQGMIAGQSIELNQNFYNKQNNPKSTDLIDNIHLLKTGKLITASLQIGAKLANCTKQQDELISLLGKNLGLAFQIQDDLLDYTKNSSTLGKPALSDQKRSLPTYPTIMGLEKANLTLLHLWNKCFDLLTQLGGENGLLFALIKLISQREY